MDAASAGARSRANRYLNDAIAIFEALGAEPDLAEARSADEVAQDVTGAYAALRSPERRLDALRVAKRRERSLTRSTAARERPNSRNTRTPLRYSWSVAVRSAFASRTRTVRPPTQRPVA